MYSGFLRIWNPEQIRQLRFTCCFGLRRGRQQSRISKRKAGNFQGDEKEQTGKPVLAGPLRNNGTE